MQDEELRKAGPNAQRLHRYYTSGCDNRKGNFTISFKAQHIQKDDGIFPVDFADLYDLFNIDALDISIMRVFSL